MTLRLDRPLPFVPVSVLTHALALLWLSRVGFVTLQAYEDPIRVIIVAGTTHPEPEPAPQTLPSSDPRLSSSDGVSGNLKAGEVVKPVAKPRTKSNARDARFVSRRKREKERTWQAPVPEKAEDALGNGVAGAIGTTGGEKTRSGYGQADSGRSGEPTDAVGRYLRAVRALIDARKRYPEEARRTGTEGVAVLAFVIEQDGRLADLKVLSADDRLFALAALAAVKDAARWIGPPPAGQPMPVQVSLRFELTERRRR